MTASTESEPQPFRPNELGLAQRPGGDSALSITTAQDALHALIFTRSTDPVWKNAVVSVLVGCVKIALADLFLLMGDPAPKDVVLMLERELGISVRLVTLLPTSIRGYLISKTEDVYTAVGPEGFTPDELCFVNNLGYKTGGILIWLVNSKEYGDTALVFFGGDFLGQERGFMPLIPIMAMFIGFYGNYLTEQGRSANVNNETTRLAACIAQMRQQLVLANLNGDMAKKSLNTLADLLRAFETRLRGAQLHELAQDQLQNIDALESVLTKLAEKGSKAHEGKRRRSKKAPALLPKNTRTPLTLIRAALEKIPEIQKSLEDELDKLVPRREIAVGMIT